MSRRRRQALAVARPGVERIGKGGGFADLEYALAATAGVISRETPVITTVHRSQVLEEELPSSRHDVCLDYVLTPGETIRCTGKAPRPEGIRRFEVLNLGVNSYSMPQTLQMARTRARELGADAIVAQLCLNDPFTAQPGYANVPLDHPSRLIGFVARRVWRERSLARTYVDSRYTKEGWRKVESSLRGLAALSADVPVLAVLVPYLAPTAYEGWGFERYHERIGAIARDAGLALLDLHPDFERAGLIDRGPGEDPIHPNPAGHELMAERILEELKRRGMLAPPDR